MTTLRGGEIERFVAKPDARRPIVLIYGADAGLVSERAAAVARAAVTDPADPLQIARFEGDELASDPLRLVDEANAMGLFGGRRAIRVRVGAKNIAPALEPLLRAPPLDSIVIVEAGELRKTAPILSLCDKSPSAAVIPCYLDGASELAQLLDARLRAAALDIDDEARTALLDSLGGDRLTTRNEIDKLVTYVGGDGPISLDHVEAVVGESGADAVDRAVDGGFSGDVAVMLPALAKVAADGGRPHAVLTAALMHAWSLAQGLRQVESGEAPAAVAKQHARFFKRQAAFERQLKLWRSEGLTPTIRGLGEAALGARKHAELSGSLCDRMMLRIALSARRGR